MKRRLQFILLSVVLISANCKAQDLESGNFLDYIDVLISNIPGEDTDEFNLPESDELTLWETAVGEILDGQYNQAHNSLSALNYRLVEFTDIVTGSVYYITEQTDSNHWGIYVFNPDPLRSQIILQAPHPKHDTNTGSQASYVFEQNGARVLCISGTHRCNSSIASSCSGASSACGGNKFQISDNAHNISTIFQTTSEILFASIYNSKFIQLHGFEKGNSDPYVIMSNGTQIQPTSTDYLSKLKNELLIEDDELTFKIAHLDNWTRLIGTTNTQGRMINSALDPCQDNSPGNNGQFIHLEQEKSRLRNNSTGWTKISNAVSRVFPLDQTINDLSLVINEIHADPASDLSGDANGDGLRSASEDEFIEIVNTSMTEANISGFKIYDSNPQTSLRHEFPDGSIIPPLEAIVVFGGGNPNGSFGSSIYQTASSGALGITNTNESMSIYNSLGILVNSYQAVVETNNNQSITRSPDLTGSATPMTQHSIANLEGTLFSPGTKIDGNNFGLDTEVQFVNSSYNVSENVGFIEINIRISNPSDLNDTTVDMVLISGSTDDIGNFTSTTVTFPAGSGANQIVVMNITDDLLVEATEQLTFELQNVSGGTNAKIKLPHSDISIK